jgi:NADH-quinone oxidoreductase subunit J
METFVFVVGALVVMGGALGVILSRNPVHAALSLVASLFGIAVLFVAQDAHLLAAVQVIVYTGAIVVLILFVLMLLGVDRAEDLETEPLTGQRPLAVLLGALGLAAVSAVLLLPVVAAEDGESTTDPVTGETVAAEDPTFGNRVLTGQPSALAPLTEVPTVVPGEEGDTPTEVAADVTGDGVPDTNIRALGSVLFTDYVFAFEATALLLTIAVVGAVVLARRVRDPQPLPPTPEPLPAFRRRPAGDGDPDGDPDDGATGDVAVEPGELVGAETGAGD